MPIQDTDLFLINTNSNAQSFKITALKLKESLAPNLYNNYKLLVNKPDYSSRFVYTQNLQQSVAPTDYMLVERAGVSYKVTGQQIIDYFPSVPAGAAGPIINVGKSLGPLEPNTLTPTPSPNVFQSCPPFNTTYSSTLKIIASPTSFTFDYPWDMSSVTKYRGGAYDAGQAITLTFTDANGRSQSVTDTTQPVYTGYHDLSGIDFSVPIAMVTITVASTPGWFWGFYDSSDQGVNYPAEVQRFIDQLTLGSTTNLDVFTAGDAIKMVDSDGAIASYTPVTSAITNVSNSTPPDWNIDAKWSDGVTPTAAAIIFDGDPSTAYGTRPYAPGNEVSFTGLPATTIENGITIKSISESGNSRVFYLDSSGVERMVIVPNTLGVHTPYSPIGSTLTKILWDEGNGGDGCGIYFIEIDGKMLVDSDVDLPDNLLSFASPNQDLKYFKPGDVVQSGVTVTSTDTIANTMSVDGGTWSNGDVVTGPIKSGTGNFNAIGYNIGGNNLPFVEVTNSNDEWIDNTNRLGEEFFITDNSTRTGLAILRTKAAELATTFNIATTYQTGDLVIFNDCYWVRDNGSWLKISESTTTY